MVQALSFPPILYKPSRLGWFCVVGEAAQVRYNGNMSRLAKNTAFLTLASVGQKLVAFVYFALIARIVGVENTGVYFLALSITTMVGVLADFGLTPVLIREVAKHPKKQQSLLSSVIGLKLGLSILAAAVVVALSFALGYDSTTRLLMYAAIAVMVLDTFHLTFYGMFRGRHDLRFESLGIVVGQLVTLAVGLSTLIIAPNLLFLILALLAGSLWNTLYAGYQLHKARIRPFLPSWDGSTAKKLLKIALPFALAAIFVKIYSTVDSILLEQYLGSEAVGFYSIAYKLTYAFQFLPMAFMAALYPTFSSLIKAGKREELGRTFEQGLWYMALIAVPVTLGVASVADLVVPLIYGTNYLASVLPLQVLIFALLLIFLDFPIGALLNADDRQVTKTAIMGGTMVINVTANVFLIPVLGILGASVSALLGFVWLLGAGFVAIRKTLVLNWTSLLVRLGPILLAGLAMAATVLLTKQWLDILTIPLGGVVYVSCLFLFKSLSIDMIRNVRQGIRS